MARPNKNKYIFIIIITGALIPILVIGGIMIYGMSQKDLKVEDDSKK